MYVVKQFTMVSTDSSGVVVAGSSAAIAAVGSAVVITDYLAVVAICGTGRASSATSVSFRVRPGRCLIASN